jgi:hypothetical protein
MTRQILATIALLLLIDTAAAVRVIAPVERPVELTLGDITFSANGRTITFSECAACSLSTHRLTDATAYELNDRALPRVEFLRALAELRDRPDGDEKTLAVVFLDLASGRVTRVEVRE